MQDSLLDNPNLSTHPLVAELQGHSNPSPSLVALAGYFGPSRKADSIRLYPSLDFRSYFEIPRREIVAAHAVNAPVGAQADQSAAIVYVKAGTPVEMVQTSTQPVETYLQGGITGGYLQGAITSGYLGVVRPLPATECPKECKSTAPF